MTLAVEDQRRVATFQFTGLPAYTREEAALANWLCRFFPGAKEWRQAVGEVFSGLIEKRTGATVHLIQTSEIEQKQETRDYAFEKPEITIGRNPTNDVVLPAKAIGRDHARIFDKGGTYHIEDLGSTLGTWINQKRLDPKQPYPLNNGDLIRTFPYTLTFEVKSSWAAETQVQFETTPVQSTSWEHFSLSTLVGSVSYDLAIQPGLGAIRMQIDRSFLVRLISRALREQPSGALLASDSGVIEFLLLSMLERINRLVAMPFHFSLQSPRLSPAFTSRGLSISFTLGLADIAGAIRIFIPAEVIASMRTKVPVQGAPRMLQQISWPFTVTAGNVEFTPAELATLEPGDIVMFALDAELRLPPGKRGTWPAVGWKGQIISADPRAFKMVRFFDERSLQMDEGANPSGEHPTVGAAAQGAPNLAQLPVRLHVVLGEVDLSLAEVSSMTGGTILELDKGKSDPVHLAVNGKILGTGELVDIDGKLGVRITGWSGS